MFHEIKIIKNLGFINSIVKKKIMLTPNED